MGNAKLTKDQLLSHLKQTEEALAHCRRVATANQFTAAVMHEVNNPLEAMTNLVYLLELDNGLAPKSREYLAALRDQLVGLAHITSTTLSFHRDQTAAQDVDLVRVAQACLKLHFARLAKYQILVQTRFADRAVSNAIASEILQVLSNLILNAIDVLPAASNPSLHLRVHRRHHGICITVADNGPGIPEEIASKLFEANITGKSAGTGMGLWLSKGLVHKHGGRVRCRSRRTAGKSGTVFQIWLPHAEAA